MKIFSFFILYTITGLFISGFPLAGISDEKRIFSVSSEEIDRELKTKNLQSNLEKLQKIKYLMLNGHLSLAKFWLTKQDYNDDSEFKLIKKRYLAQIHFIEGQYEKSYHLLNSPEFNSPRHFALICQLKLLNKIILDKTGDLRSDYQYCLQLNKDTFTQSIWVDHLVGLKTKNDYILKGHEFKHIHRLSLQSDELKIWLKLSLYLNQEKKIYEIIPHILLDSYRDPEVRELIGLIYYRLGQYKKAYEFIEDLDSANTENIKGNLLLSKKKYQLAYGHFKLALQKKQNSYNALERLVSLAWLLADWENGESLSKKLRAPTGKEKQKIALQSAFLSKLKKHSEALRILDQFNGDNISGLPLEMAQLYSYNAFMQKDIKRARLFADLACKKYDGFNCALLTQLALFKDLPHMMNQDNPTFDSKEITLEKLKGEAPLSPIEEEVFINQKEIEELEDQSISVIRN